MSEIGRIQSVEVDGYEFKLNEIVCVPGEGELVRFKIEMFHPSGGTYAFLARAVDDYSIGWHDLSKVEREPVALRRVEQRLKDELAVVQARLAEYE